MAHSSHVRFFGLPKTSCENSQEPQSDEFEKFSQYIGQVAETVYKAVPNYLQTLYFKTPDLGDYDSPTALLQQDKANGAQIMYDGGWYPQTSGTVPLGKIDNDTLKASVASSPLNWIYHTSHVVAFRAPKGSLAGYKPCTGDPLPWEFSACDDDGTWWGSSRLQTYDSEYAGIEPDTFDPELKNWDELGDVNPCCLLPILHQVRH